MSLINRATNLSNIIAGITDNGNKEITGAILRQILIDLADSHANLIDEVNQLGLNEYDPARTYNTDQAVIFESGIFQANEDSITGVFNPIKWTFIVQIDDPTKFGFVGFDIGTTFNIDDRVLSLNRFFICDINGTLGIVPDDVSANWTEVFVNNGAFANDYVVGKFYLNGHVVQDSGSLFQLVATTLPAFESTDLAAEITAGDWILFNNHTELTGAVIKALLFAESDTNNLTDALLSILNNQSGTNTGDEPDATEAVKGIIERATQAETDTGTDNLRAITPLRLKTLLDSLGITNLFSLLSDDFTSSLVLGAGFTVIPNATYTIGAGEDGSVIPEWSGSIELVGDTTVNIGIFKNGVQQTTRTLQNNQGGGAGRTVIFSPHIKTKINVVETDTVDVRANVSVGAATVRTSGDFFTFKSN